MSKPTLETRCVGTVSVKFNDILLRDAGGLVQPIDVLRDHVPTLTQFHELSNCSMASIRHRIAHIFINYDFASPRLFAHFYRRNKVLELNRLLLRPNATRAAKVWDTGFCTNTRPGENRYSIGGLN